MLTTPWNIITIVKLTVVHLVNVLSFLKDTCFGQFFCASSGVFHCTHCNYMCHIGMLTTPWNIITIVKLTVVHLVNVLYFLKETEILLSC